MAGITVIDEGKREYVYHPSHPESKANFALLKSWPWNSGIVGSFCQQGEQFCCTTKEPQHSSFYNYGNVTGKNVVVFSRVRFGGD